MGRHMKAGVGVTAIFGLALGGSGWAGPPARAARGTLTKDEVGGTINQHKDDIRSCYERELSKHPEAGGKLVVTFTIGVTGAVTASSARSTTLPATVSVCVAQTVKKWTFPKPHGGGSLTVSYPFLFNNNGNIRG